MTLYAHYQKRSYEDFRLQAALQGIDLDETKNKKNKKKPVKTPVNNGGFIPFMKPEDYKDMTQSEKEDLTNRMKMSHKHWANKKDRV